MKKYHQIYYFKISSNLLFENIIKFVFFAILVAFICDGGAGRGGCGGSSATAGGAGEGAVGRRRRWSGGGCGGAAATAGGAREMVRGVLRRGGPDLARWDSDRDEGGSRSSVHEI